ncbi:MAG TPA: glycosyltransferase [Acidimicrobiales bacterium]
MTATEAPGVGRVADRVDGVERPRFDVVIPTVGRPSLAPLVDTLARTLPAGSRLLVVDDRPGGGGLDGLGVLDVLGGAGPDGSGGPAASPGWERAEVVRGGGRGPAAARNVGWRASTAPWIAFLDDDVDLPPDWVRRLEDDLANAADPAVVAVQGRVRVPPPPRGRRPSDWERNVQGLEGAPWITADLVVRRAALAAVGGFDERFPRAYREDSDLALRLLDRGGRLAVGERRVRHPVRPAPWWVSVRLQQGNADDVTMERLHGPGWRARLGSAAGTYPQHRATVAVGAAGLAALALGRRRPAVAGLGWWAVRWLRFAAARIAPGPRTRREVAAMVVTSALIPPAACAHRARGHLRWVIRS